MQEPSYHLEGVVQSKAALPEDFEGPLDVILLLLSKNKIEIEDISISSILDQYLAYLDEQKRLDMEIASEFIAMASHLMYIKTKMLLSLSDREEAMGEMELLISSLEERKRKEAREQIRTAVQFLEGRNDIGRGCFTKQPEPYEKDLTYRYQHDREDLKKALAAVADRAERQLPPPMSNFEGIVGREPYSLAKKTKEVLRRLLISGASRFLDLFRGSKTRSEVVATFLSVLELCKLRSVNISDEDDSVTFLRMPEEAIEIEE